MIIYLTTNLINGKQYVGQTIRKDKNYFGSGTILNNAIKKYGKENFKRITLKECFSQKELNFWEEYFVEACNTVTPEGYNLRLGGNSGGALSEEIVQKMKDAHKSRPRGEYHPLYGVARTEKIKQKVSEGLKRFYENNPKDQSGENNPNYGKTLEEIHGIGCQCPFCKAKRGELKGENHPQFGIPHSEEMKRKNSESHKGKKHHMYGKTYEELYGEERAKELKKKRSDVMLGHKHTKESIQKMKESHRKRRIRKLEETVQ